MAVPTAAHPGSRSRDEIDRVATRLFRRAMSLTGWSQERLGEWWGIAQATVWKKLTPGENRPLTFADVVTAPPEIRVFLARYLDRSLGRQSVALPAKGGGGDDLTLLARVVRELGDVTRGHASALANRVITAGEAADLEPEIDQAEEALETLRARLREAEERGALRLTEGRDG